MIKGFILPNRASAVQGLIDTMGGSSFNTVHYFSQTKGVAIFIPKWGKYHMHMVWHNHYPVDL